MFWSNQYQLKPQKIYDIYNHNLNFTKKRSYIFLCGTLYAFRKCYNNITKVFTRKTRQRISDVHFISVMLEALTDSKLLLTVGTKTITNLYRPSPALRTPILQSVRRGWRKKNIPIMICEFYIEQLFYTEHNVLLK